MSSAVLFQTFIFLAAACIVVPLASRFKLGSVLGYLIAGILIGPFGLGLIGNAEQIMHFAEFGVVMMLFLIGLELEPAMLWRLKRTIIGLGSLQVILTSAAFTALGVAMGYTWQVSTAVGMALSLSSTALVLQMLNEKNLMQTAIGESAFAVLLFQDIAVIGILVLIPLLATGSPAVADSHSINILATLPAWAQALSVAAIIATVIVIGRYILPHIFHAMAKTNLREVFTATSLALVVGITLLMLSIGMSPALGAFIAGVVLANSHYKRTLETDIEPFKGLLLGLFFISVGMGMDFDLLAASPVDMALAVLAIIAIKASLMFGLGVMFGLTRVHSYGFALSLAQGSEFAFVLLTYATASRVLPAETANFFTLAVAISMAATPFLMLYYSRIIVPCFMSILPERSFDTIEAEHPIVLAGYGRFGQIIGRFLGAQGISLTVLESDPEQINLLRKFGFKGYFGDATRLDILQSAGLSKAKLFIVAIGDPDTCINVVRLAREEFPHLTIYARARNRRHAYELHKLGVHYFKRDTFDSSLTMASDIMRFLGYPADDIARKATAFQQHDEETLERSFPLMDKENELIDFARQARGELERIMQEDRVETSST